MSHYVVELKRLGYVDTVKDFFNKIKISKIETIIDQSYCSELMKAALKKMVRKRYQELLNGLQD